MGKKYEEVKRSLFFKKFGNTAGGFETALWNAFDRADHRNKALLGEGFPVHLAVFNDWYNSSSEREYFSEQLFIRATEEIQ